MRHINAPIAGATTALLALATTTLLFCAPAADARTALAELRVEGPNGTLDSGTWYVTGSERVKRAKQGDDCEPRPGAQLFRGPTALGILGTADDSKRRLRPVRFRTTEFGPQICQVGGLRSFGHYPNASGGFLYWTDFVSGFSSPDLAEVSDGERVLWYYAVFPSDPPQPGDPPSANTGNALELKAVPARDGDGEFEARVVLHDFDGTPSPVSDATIEGAQSVTPLGSGRYAVVVDRGRSVLTAERGLNVRSNHVATCFRQNLARCPKAHGRTIVGGPRDDDLPGTRGFDRITGAGGDDRIDLRKGGRDRAGCGGGDDVVLLDRGDRDDRIRDDCERVRRS